MVKCCAWDELHCVAANDFLGHERDGNIRTILGGDLRYGKVIGIRLGDLSKQGRELRVPAGRFCFAVGAEIAHEFHSPSDLGKLSQLIGPSAHEPQAVTFLPIDEVVPAHVWPNELPSFW